MKNIYLVDTEHFNPNTLPNNLSFDNNDLVILFLTENTNHEYFNENKAYSLFKNVKNIKRINLLTSSNSNTNFQILNHLNSLIISAEHKYITYNLISEDKSFNSSIDLLNNCSDTLVKLISSPANFIAKDIEISKENKLNLDDTKALYTTLNTLEISNDTENLDNKEDILNSMEPFLNQNPNTYLQTDNSCIQKDYANILATLTYEENRLVAAIKNKGFSKKTGLKIVSIIRSSNSQDEALGRIFTSFSADLNTFNHIQDSILNYFKSENEPLEPALAD